MSKRLWWFSALSLALFTLVIGGLQWWKYGHFGYNGLDLGIYSQTVWSLAHGHGFASSIHDPSYLGDHLEVWLVPISWLYRLWSSPLLLLWVQTIVIGSTIIPLVKLASRKLGERAAIIAAILFIVHPLVYNVALYEFHGLAFALPLLLWSIWWYVERRYWPWLICIVGLLLVREDMPLLVAGWALMAAIDRRNWRWWVPPLVVAGAWFGAAQMIIRAANHDGVYKFFAFYQWLGKTPSVMLLFPFQHPWLFIQHIVSLDNIGTIVGLLVTVGFLPLIRPRRLWPLTFVAVQLLIGGAQPGSFLRIHYVIPYLPFLWWATIVAVGEVRDGNVLRRYDRSILLTAVVIIAIIGPLYSSLIIGPAEWPWTGVRRDAPTAAIVARQALADVHPMDRVLTTFNYLPFFANRSAIYSLNYLYLGRRQYSEIPYVVPSDIDVAVIDWQQLYEYQFLYRTTVYEGRDGPQRIKDFLASQGLSLVRQYGTVAVYRRGGVPDTSSVQTIPQSDAPVVPLGLVSLVGSATVATSDQPGQPWHEVSLELTWRSVDMAADAPVSIRYMVMQNNHVVWQAPQVIGQGPLPASDWAPGTDWKTHVALAVPLSIRGNIQLSAEIFVPQGRYRLDRWRTFRTILDNIHSSGTVKLGSVRL